MLTPTSHSIKCGWGGGAHEHPGRPASGQGASRADEPAGGSARRLQASRATVGTRGRCCLARTSQERAARFGPRSRRPATQPLTENDVLAFLFSQSLTQISSTFKEKQASIGEESPRLRGRLQRQPEGWPVKEQATRPWRLCSAQHGPPHSPTRHHLPCQAGGLCCTPGPSPDP